MDRARTQVVPQLPAKPPPSQPLAVGVRGMKTSRDGRPLRVTIYYPARGKASDQPRRDATAASGKFPVVVFSHGLNGTPADYQTLLTRWAAAGFVVAAPAYPYTTRGAAQFNVLDVLHQPADASQVLSAVLAAEGGRVDPQRVAAAGPSAGAITTVGIFTAKKRDDRFDAGVVLAGNGLGVGTAFAGPAAPMLFVHGKQDPLVSYGSGQEAFGKVPWPKAFLSLPGENHADPYLDPTDPAFAVVSATTTDFLRWSLYGDSAARNRLGTDAQTDGLGTLEDKL